MTETTERRAAAACSFCMKPSTEVSALVAGPGVFICNECVDLCAQIIASKDKGPEDKGPESRQAAPSTLWERFEDLDSLLDVLPKAAAAGAQVEENLTQLVRRARALGATWAKIGAALGMTRQSAWERFSGEE